MPPALRKRIASLRDRDRGMRFAEVPEVGCVRPRRTRQGKIRWFVDLRPYGRIFSVPGFGPLASEVDAARVLGHIQGELARGASIEEILAQYLPANAKPYRVTSKIEAWLAGKHDEVEAGDLSPTYLRELRRYAHADGHFSWWAEQNIFEITTAAVDDWNRWLRKRGISAKTRRNVIGAFRSMLGWLKRRGELRELPEMPTVTTDEHSPKLISAEDQDAILAAIPEPRRGIFLALARLGLRPSEARALQPRDYRDGWLTVARASKGPRKDSPVRGTKTRRVRRVPVDDELKAWIEQYVRPADRLKGTAPLFRNPEGYTSDGRWLPSALRRTWSAACQKSGVQVGLYEGTKHAFATDAVRRGVQERHIQAFLGHADVRSTRRYARLADQGLVSVLRPRATSERQDFEATKRPKP